MLNLLRYKDENFHIRIAEIINSRKNFDEDITNQVNDIILDIKNNGNISLFKYMSKYDNVECSAENICYSKEDILSAKKNCTRESIEAIKLAKNRIEAFHQHQLPEDSTYEDQEEVSIKTKWIPLDSAGIYIPGGTASYPSSVLMGVIPAQVAGVKKIFATVPCPNNEIDPLVLATLDLCGIEKIYKIGGAQAIAALTWGTESVENVDIIIGPGNKWVAEAKKQALSNINIDMLAGPSEILILADENNRADWVAADLLSQAEHDISAQAILVTDSENLLENVNKELVSQTKELKRKDIVKKSIAENGYGILVSNINDAIEIINNIAPEHLSILCKENSQIENKITNAGVIFSDEWTPESMGDYIIGPSHILPTNGMAKRQSGLSVYNFLRRQSTISSSKKTITTLGPSAMLLADCEGLDAHANSIKIRIKDS
ncbi:MAG: histidinol dehydrogenase [Alphaproteobacteria bacterium]